MTRGTGFASADIDVGFFRDTRVKRLAREHAEVFPVAVLGYIGIVLHCWSVGERLPATDAWPDLVPWSDAAVEALKAVELLDRAGRVRPGAWQGWFGVAYARREIRRGIGSIGGQKARANRLAKLTEGASETTSATTSSATSATTSHARPLSYPSVPTVPTDSPLPPQAGARPRTRRKNGDTPRSNGKSPRQLREGSPEVDARAMADVTARTAAWNEAHPDDQITTTKVDVDWIEGGSDATR